MSEHRKVRQSNSLNRRADTPQDIVQQAKKQGKRGNSLEPVSDCSHTTSQSQSILIILIVNKNCFTEMGSQKKSKKRKEVDLMDLRDLQNMMNLSMQII